jgi:drug/metabolite transporter (DMT)-like permease
VRPGARTAALTVAALAGFAANSLLCRAALRSGHADAASFTAVRLATGALTLWILAVRGRTPIRGAGSWPAALALFAYAAPFSFAYVRIGVGVGALIAFGAVQTTMITWALRTGERPRPAEWAGIACAVAGLVGLVAGGLSAPDPLGAGLMLVAGVAWGAYSLMGRASVHPPLATTAANFARALPLAVALGLAAVALRSAHISARGVLLATASGAVASGIGYSLWYAALRGLSATRAAVVQLSVPVLAAAGGVLLLGETLTPRLIASGTAILGGVALAVAFRPTPSAARPPR